MAHLICSIKYEFIEEKPAELESDVCEFAIFFETHCVSVHTTGLEE